MRAARNRRHNRSLRQKAMANAYIKKCEPTATVTTATSASNLQNVLINESTTHKPDPNSTYTKSAANETLSIDREVTPPYDMTPPL
ncbi:unnamed protein product [Oppiella nova]|uniref:Uncharacterized protein n=1 Tax=Oppiella nova TaxID=334625 RepID=A0A7R9QUH1_9ACAR|nr:unnamed protein product [Oppiella nova]CAG2174815.1 unnamed protein product [Oppiella nova]